MKNLTLLLLIFLNSCGDSPFLEEKEGTPLIAGEQLQSGLSLPGGLYNFTPKWRSGPNIGSESKIQILVTNSEDRPTSIEGDFTLMLWMPTMGHGSFPVTVEEVGVGLYEASQVFFTMPGYWDIHFQVTNGDDMQEVLWGFTL